MHVPRRRRKHFGWETFTRIKNDIYIHVYTYKHRYIFSFYSDSGFYTVRPAHLYRIMDNWVILSENLFLLKFMVFKIGRASCRERV